MKLNNYSIQNFKQIEYLKSLPPSVKEEIEIVAKVLPFKTNNYVVDYLIDWENYEHDPLFILTFPNKSMLRKEQYEEVSRAVKNNVPKAELNKIVNRIRMLLNPHPAQQMTNVPKLDGIQLNGCQHKYDDIILFFPSQGQTCHAHCTFCFRWPQFIKELDLQFSMREIDPVIRYIRQNEQINEILITGGDPMTMNPTTIRKYVEALLRARLPNLKTIRFGSKALTFWPFTFIPEYNPEAREMLNLFKLITENGLHLAFMAHFNHPNELQNEVVEKAIYNIRETGATIRTQAPLLKNINDNSDVWTRMWEKQVSLGMIPYYMFVERETGPYDYFSLPLAEVYQIYQKAINKSSSFAKTVTAPVMSTSPGKVQIMNILKNPINGEKYFMLQFVRHRDKSKTFKPFLTKFNEEATWFDQLELVEMENALL